MDIGSFNLRRSQVIKMGNSLSKAGFSFLLFCTIKIIVYKTVVSLQVSSKENLFLGRKNIGGAFAHPSCTPMLLLCS